jgi:hypothetical protein
MKKNYLLLFLIALLFGTATMRADMLKFGDIKVDKRYYLKIGNGFLFLPEVVDSFRIRKGVKQPRRIARGKIACFTDQAKATKLKFSPEQGGTSLIQSFEASDYKGKYGGPIVYSIDGEILSTGALLCSFNYVNEGGKYYLKAAEVGAGVGKYLTNKAGTVTLEATASPDAVIEFFDPNGANQAEVAEHLKKMLNRLSFFQSYRHQLGDKSQDSPFLGNGLGQYPRPNIPSTNAIIKEEWSYFSVNMYRKDFAGLKGDDATASNIEIVEHCEANLHINKPQAGTYVVISTKSQYEDKIRLNDNRSSELNFTPGSAAGASQPAKYLVSKATGYELTTDKAKASVFYFDGDHLTGLDNGFGLNTTQNKYDLTEDAQKAVVKQGKLEKTLDAGSYSLKVGDKFVKLDNTGLSVTDNESESHIFLEEATEFKLNTDALGYVSFFAPTAVEILDNVEVYTGKLNAQNSVVNLKKVNTKKIPEKTAVLLRKGTSKTSFTVKKIASAPAITDNSLQGYTVSSNKNVANAYGFAVQNGKLVFVPIADGVRAFKAVIFNGNAAGMQEFIPTAFVPTGIEGVTAEENKEEIFDLTGRRVESPVKGQVYVKGGKKFIQK